VPHRSADSLTNVGAIGAIGTYWWLPHLQTLSEVAAIIAPILGVLWLLLQMGLKLHDHFKKKKVLEDLKKDLANANPN